MIANDTFWCTGKGPEYMLRQFGVSVLKGEDLAYQVGDSFESEGWYTWELCGVAEGPFDTPMEAIESQYDETDKEHAALLQVVADTYGEIYPVNHSVFGKVYGPQRCAGQSVYAADSDNLKNSKHGHKVMLATEAMREAHHTGWYADPDGFELYSGEAWACGETGRYFAVVVSDDTDSVWLSVKTFESTELEEAAREADAIAEALAQQEREYRETMDMAAMIRQELRHGASCIREGTLLRRRLAADPQEADATLHAVADRLVREGKATRKAAWSKHRECNPSTEGWSEGWQAGV